MRAERLTERYGRDQLLHIANAVMAEIELSCRHKHPKHIPVARLADVSQMARTYGPRVGCSGWNYMSWKGRFYPASLPTIRWLEFYATRFDAVEVNNTFYRLPERHVFQSWQARVPSSFMM